MHQLKKEPKMVEPRINLTFRQFKKWGVEIGLKNVEKGVLKIIFWKIGPP
jgi:hypothetical protein